MMKFFYHIATFFLYISLMFFGTGYAKAAVDINCDNRYATLVNPVRGRDLWIDKSVKPLKDQYNTAREFNLPVTWLLQYDVLKDEDLLKEVRGFDPSQEIGIFLEVSADYASQARVIYPHAVPWFSPQAVFLSGYPQSDRRKLIDKLFLEFKLTFGYYPKSVGGWWIDSYSLNYMKEKYNIKSALIVADQKTTDNYGVWGQWWGVPYYPSEANILTPASSLDNKLSVLIIQWAQRDSKLALGDGPKYSNYSLQANDYTERGRDTLYFRQLVDSYLDCKNPIGQITVGLESGIESVGHIKEYQNQLTVLKKIDNLQFATMSLMSEKFAKVYPDFPQQAEVKLDDSVWKMTTSSRMNEKLNDRINYQPGVSFSDYFIAEKADFLNRRLPVESNQRNYLFFPIFVWIGLGLGIISIIKKKFKPWVLSMLFGLAAFGLIFRSYFQYGWKVYYGPVVPELELVQAGLVLISFLVFLAVNKKYKNIYILPLIFGLDPLIQSFRFSIISNKYYFGIAADALRFVGFNISSTGVSFLNFDLPAYQAAALLKFNFEKVWNNLYLALFVYPVIHLLVGAALTYLLAKLPVRVRFFVVVALGGLFIWHIINIFNVDPRQVLPILIQYS